MGRPSFVHIAVEVGGDGVIGATRVGGGVVPVLEGRLRDP
jgi:hypothetical protein